RAELPSPPLEHRGIERDLDLAERQLKDAGTQLDDGAVIGLERSCEGMVVDVGGVPQASIEAVRFVLRILWKEECPGIDSGPEVIAPITRLDAVDVRQLGQGEQRTRSASARHDRIVELVERGHRIVLEVLDEPFLFEDGPGRVARLVVRDGAGGQLPLDNQGLDLPNPNRARDPEGREGKADGEQRAPPSATAAGQSDQEL